MSFEKNFESIINSLERFATSKTVVSEPIVIGDLTLVPLLDISLGAGAGAGSEGSKQSEGGGGGGGAKISTAAVLAVKDGNVTVINIKNTDSVSKVIDLAPQVISNITSFFNKNKDESVKSDTSAGGDNSANKIAGDFDFPVDVV